MGNKENYDWYEEDFTSFLLSLSLPAYRKDIPLKEALLAEKESFVVSFKEMTSRHRFMSFSNAFYADLSAQLPHIKTSFDLLYKIVNYYNRGDMAGAQRAFDTLMDILSKHLFIFDITWPDFPSSFYRVSIINSGRKSITYTARTEAKIESFTKLYKRFQTDIIEIAESFIRKVDIMPAPTAEKFYTIR